MATYKTIEKIPTWSLGYLINGDSTGLTDEEIALADQWSKDRGEYATLFYPRSSLWTTHRGRGLHPYLQRVNKNINL